MMARHNEGAFIAPGWVNSGDLGRLDADGLSLEAVGEAMAIAPQTLRRRLREEGHGFQALKDALRRDTAIACLARPELTLPEIAQRLGFSEASTFHRAFKKWTGVAPGEYRLTRIAGLPPASSSVIGPP